MTEDITKEDYENMAKLICAKDKQMAQNAVDLIERYEADVVDVLADIQQFINELPAVDYTSRTSIRNTIETSLSQISAVISQVGYTKTSLNTHIANVT